MTRPGLRERKKIETREAIAFAAVHLTAEHGLDATTCEAIAEAAHVAPRTFRNYFPNKETAILFAVDRFVTRFLEFLRARPEDESILASLEEAAVAVVESRDEVARILTVRSMTQENAQLRVHWAAAKVNLDLAAITTEIARRTGTDARHDVYPRVVTAAAWGVLGAAIDMQAGRRVDVSQLEERVRIGFATLQRGLSTPTAG
jgi:AcrR family transcriptional regulator